MEILKVNSLNQPYKVKEILLLKPIAHRGLHDRARGIPENSLVAFSEAIRYGYPIELDVQLLKDGNLAVFHDESLERMCDASVKIQDLDYLTIKDFFLQGTRESIPLLSEVLSLVKGQVPLIIEIKQPNKVGNLETELASLLDTYNGLYAVQSFNPLSLAWFATHRPAVLRGQLSGNYRGERINVIVKFILKNFLLNWKSKPNFIGYDQKSMPNRRVARMRKRNMPIICWTVRSKEEYEQIFEKCDNIIFENFTP